MAEAWVALFKGELVDGRRFASFEQAEHQTLAWIGFYNLERLHEGLGYRPPAEYEALFGGRAVDGAAAGTAAISPPPADRQHPLPPRLGEPAQHRPRASGPTTGGLTTPPTAATTTEPHHRDRQPTVAR